MSFARAERRFGVPVKVIRIQEAGLDGFWIDRVLKATDVESQLVDPGSLPYLGTSGGPNAIDGQTLLTDSPGGCP